MNQEIRSCNVEDARKEIYLNPGYQLVDVREQPEYDIVRIVNSLLIPLSTLQENYQCIDKERPSYLMCGVGKRAMVAAQFLLSKGYTNIYVVEGGIKAWINAGYAVVGDKDKYLMMHSN